MAEINIKAKIRALPYSIPSNDVIIGSAPNDLQAALDAVLNPGPTANVPSVSGLQWQEITINQALIPTELIDFLQKTLNVLAAVSTALTTALQFLQLFINSFNSFANALSALITVLEQIIQKLLEDLLSTGVYWNFFVPPSLQKNMFQNNNWQRLSSGGFNGFLNRLQVSLGNTADPNRPTFTSNAVVGGFIIIVDSESLDQVFVALDQLKELFGSVDLSKIVTTPPPPRNIRSYPVYNPDESNPFKINLQWDAPPGWGFNHGFYRISRSVVQGGEFETFYDPPTKLFGKDGLFQAIRIRWATRDKEIDPITGQKRTKPAGKKWPAQYRWAYKDPDFNNGKPVIVKSNLFGGGQYIDDDIPMDSEGNPIYVNYYYIIEAGWPTDGFTSGTGILFYPNGYWGQRSAEHHSVVQKKCLDGSSGAISQHGNGNYEYMLVGFGSLGNWSSIQLGRLIPFLPQFADMVNQLIKTLKGSLKTANESVTDFIRGIQDKIEFYLLLVDLISAIITAVLRFLSLPKVAWLWVSPEAGGTEKFMSRVRSAQPPASSQWSDGFSGPDGVTAGIVFMFGAPNFDFDGTGDSDAIEQRLALVQNSFNTLIDLFGG